MCIMQPRQLPIAGVFNIFICIFKILLSSKQNSRWRLELEHLALSLISSQLELVSLNSQHSPGSALGLSNLNTLFFVVLSRFWKMGLSAHHSHFASYHDAVSLGTGSLCTSFTVLLCGAGAGHTCNRGSAGFQNISSTFAECYWHKKKGNGRVAYFCTLWGWRWEIWVWISLLKAVGKDWDPSWFFTYMVKTALGHV